LILRLMVWRYFGRSSAKLVTWLRSAQPSPVARPRASVTTRITAGMRGSRVRCTCETRGLSRNVPSMASAIGMSTMRAQ
jgi:hypothetical protein